MPDYLSHFAASFCLANPGVRAFRIGCQEDMFAPGPRGGDRLVYDSRDMSCAGDEICVDGPDATAYCMNVVQAGQSILKGPGSKVRSERPKLPDQAARIVQDHGQLKNELYSPSDGSDVFEVVLTGQNPDSLLWAENLKIQPTIGQKEVGASDECNDCTRHSIKNWPKDADGMGISVSVKNEADIFTMNYGRFFVPS